MSGDNNVSTNERIKGIELSPCLRRGKWSREEETYAEKLINAFKNGLVSPCANEGKTLRCYLAYKLNCIPMRISKKFRHCEGLGSRFFPRTGITSDQVLLCETELRELRQKFLYADSKKGLRSEPLISHVDPYLADSSSFTLPDSKCTTDSVNSDNIEELSAEDAILFDFLDSEFMQDTSASDQSVATENIPQISSTNQEIHSYRKAEKVRKYDRDATDITGDLYSSSTLESCPNKRVCYSWEESNMFLSNPPNLSFNYQDWSTTPYQYPLNNHNRDLFFIYYDNWNTPIFSQSC
mmetsp:Transcript_18222/g.18285  ORF Transcript_18222/g.18285 Transcript_18222/m.18285 type:complete len:295 (+) Transcript_18222:71-955(+)